MGAIETGVEDSEGSPMVVVEAVEGKTRGGEERIERVCLNDSRESGLERQGGNGEP